MRTPLQVLKDVLLALEDAERWDDDFTPADPDRHGVPTSAVDSSGRCWVRPTGSLFFRRTDGDAIATWSSIREAGIREASWTRI